MRAHVDSSSTSHRLGHRTLSLRGLQYHGTGRLNRSIDLGEIVAGKKRSLLVGVSCGRSLRATPYQERQDGGCILAAHAEFGKKDAYDCAFSLYADMLFAESLRE